MTHPTIRPRDRVLAVGYGLTCHLSFLAGVAAMIYGLHEGLQGGFGPFRGAWALAANALLVLQFPLLHTLLLSKRGAPWLARLAPPHLARSLATTNFATFASLQLLTVFLLWSPSGVVWFEPSGPLRWGMQGLYALSWVLVVKTMGDAGLSTQLGYLGWWSVARGRQPQYPGFPQAKSFGVCRQPIYLAFALTLWTGPVWTPDHLAVALLWTGYCVVGPVFKERRYVQRYGEAFRAYQARVPFFPGLRVGVEARLEERAA
ncbi:MAG: isoprenylcysteine carboxylmethyltransferase family protein [Planctomycetes bacterium]|nr:isoprenylcysteine carboxylmethyltransferase family protein [Planctomycetota bacterium]